MYEVTIQDLVPSQLAGREGLSQKRAYKINKICKILMGEPTCIRVKERVPASSDELRATGNALLGVEPLPRTRGMFRREKSTQKKTMPSNGGVGRIVQHVGDTQGEVKNTPPPLLPPSFICPHLQPAVAHSH